MVSHISRGGRWLPHLSGHPPLDAAPSDSGGLTVCTGPLSFAIFALARAHRALAGAMLRDLGLHPGQELLLMQLMERDGQTQSELLASVGLDHSTVPQGVAAHAGDRPAAPRSRCARPPRTAGFLTDKGRAMGEPLEAMWSRLKQLPTHYLEPDQIDAFVALARTIEHLPSGQRLFRLASSRCARMGL